MKKTTGFIIILAAALGLSACDLLMGPLSEISLQQRLEKGWVKEDVFSVTTNYGVSSVTAKLSLFYANGEMGGIFGVNHQAIAQQIFHFTKGGTTGLYTNTNLAPFSNIFDYIVEGSDYYAVTRNDNLSPYAFLYKNNSLYDQWTDGTVGGSMSGYVFLKSATDVIYNNGLYIYDASWNSASSGIIYSFSGNLSSMVKCRNKYKDHTIFVVMTNTVAPYSIVILDADSGSLIDGGLTLTANGSHVVDLVSDNTNLYLLVYGSIFKYNESAGRFEEKASISGPFSSELSLRKGVIYNGGLFVFYVGWESTSSVKAKIVRMDIASGDFLTSDLDGFDASSLQTVAIDLYYDDNEGALYAGFVELSGSQWKGYWYKNQMN